MTETSTSTAGAPNTAARKIAVVGSGYMGGGIAQVLALGGARVALADVSAEVAQKNFDRLLEESDQFIKDGLFPEGSTEILKQNLWAAKDIEEAYAAQKLSFDRKKLQLAEPIKALGLSDVAVKLHAKVTATLRVEVIKASS